jgi:hypothetical protein
MFWLQHPVGHDAVVHSHTPELLHACPLTQPPHIAPPVPHLLAL